MADSGREDGEMVAREVSKGQNDTDESNGTKDEGDLVEIKIVDDKAARGLVSDEKRKAAGGKKRKKKRPAGRKWAVLVVGMRGEAELLQCTKQAIMRRVSVPARDLRLHGPLLSPAAAILGREGCMMVNLEHIKAIISAHELLLFHPSSPPVAAFAAHLEARAGHGSRRRAGTGKKSGSNSGRGACRGAGRGTGEGKDTGTGAGTDTCSCPCC
ncbi:hypothetical protein CLOM_g9600 [Closterium sp. NIES-68]|nr:hypothetical protein CLOM_g9600 [Closterium sp. NIES-68]